MPLACFFTPLTTLALAGMIRNANTENLNLSVEVFCRLFDVIFIQYSHSFASKRLWTS